MKRPVLEFLLCLLLLTAHQVFPQNNRSITISRIYKNQALSEILTEFEKPYKIKFSYLDQLIENKQITTSFSRQPLSQALKLILQGTNLAFQIVDSTNVIIFKKTVEERFSINGRIVEKESGTSVPFANAIIASLGTGDAADSSGSFEISGLMPDTYLVEIRAIGYKKFSAKIDLKNNFNLNAELEIQPIELAAVEINPGIIQITSDETAANTLSSREILSAPTFINDIYSSMRVLPGVESTDFRARPTIKGGHPNETAILLDNMEILEPYHLYELDGPAGIINSEAVRDIKLLTGGFSAKYADRMSGIIDVRTLDKPLDRTVQISLDFAVAALLLNKKINDKLSYFFSARRVYLDLGRRDLREFKPPVTYDFWSKLSYRANPSHRFAVNFLFSTDKETYNDSLALLKPEHFNSLRRNYYTWVNWHWLAGKNHYSTTTVGFQSLNKGSGFLFEESLSQDNKDNRHNQVFSIKQNSYWEALKRHSFEYGFEFKKFISNYHFNEIRINDFKTTADNIVVDSILVDSEFNGHTLSGFFQSTWELSNRLKFLTGLRISTQSYTDHIQIAPRSSISYNFTDKLSLKLAYGWYYQPDDFYKMKSYQGQSLPNKIVSKNIQYLTELNYDISDNTTLRLDIYYKDYKRLQEDYDFDFFNRYDQYNVLDVPFDPVSAYSTGIETFFKHQYGNGSLLNIAYAYSKNKIKNQAGLVVPRDFDQTHALTISNIFNPGYNITLSILWRYRTGYPYTPSQIKTIGDNTVGGDTVIYYEFAEKNSKRLPDFHSLDLRVEKNWHFKKASLKLFANALNILDHKNVRSIYWDDMGVVDNRVIGYNLQDFHFHEFFSFGIGVSF